MYFLDEDEQGRRSAIGLFDLETLTILSPAELVKQYEQGM